MHSLKIVTAIRQIEALVTHWEIRDLLAAQSHCQADPVMKGRIDHLVPFETTRRVGDCHVAKLAPPTFDERHGELIGRKRFDLFPDCARWKRIELFLYEGHRPLNFK